MCVYSRVWCKRECPFTPGRLEDSFGDPLVSLYLILLNQVLTERVAGLVLSLLHTVLGLQ